MLSKEKFLERELETMQTFRLEFVRGGEVKGVQVRYCSFICQDLDRDMHREECEI